MVGHRKRTFELTVMGTSDLHGTLLSWDYYRNAPYRHRLGDGAG